MIIDKIHITTFRAIQNQEFTMGRWLTGIFGRNRTQKSTLLGIISQGFTIPDGHVFAKEKTLDGYNFKSQMSEKFKFDTRFEKIGSHQWTVYLNSSVKDHVAEYPIKSYPRYGSNLNNPIRFWYAKDKNSAINYVERPVYYLSLKRLYPIGESLLHKKSPVEKLGNDSLQEEFVAIYADIMTDTSVIPVIAKSGKDMFEGVDSAESSYLTNSAGQGNVSKIIIAVLSFQNLKTKFPQEYKGGILLIDELDVTLHPCAQRKMVRFLAKKAKELDLQIVFTSHSKVVLDELKKLSLPDHSGKNHKVLFLERQTSGIRIHDVDSIQGYKEVEADLELISYKPEKIKVYCEDVTSTKLLQHLLPQTIKQHLSFQTISIGLPEYIKLYQKKFYDLRRGIIVLDGDWESIVSVNQRQIVQKAKTIVPLPKEECLEVAIFKLIAPMDSEKFEKRFKEKKDVIFRDFSPVQFNQKAKCPAQQKEFAKDFFKQTEIQGKLFTFWKELHEQDCKKFVSNFTSAYNVLAKQLEIDLIN